MEVNAVVMVSVVCGLMQCVTEFMIEYIVMKANDKKIFNHKTFEEQSSLFWQLMRQQPGFNQSKDTINFQQYLSVSNILSIGSCII